MGVLSKFEGGLDSAFDRAAGAVFRGPIEPAQVAKRAEKQMNREKLVGAGRQYAPTLYTVLVNGNDNRKLFGFYPTMAAEIETYLIGKGTQAGLKFDGRPLVRFMVDQKLKSGKFDVIAENVAAPIIEQLRDEELEFYGLKESASPIPAPAAAPAAGAGAAFAAGAAASAASAAASAPASAAPQPRGVGRSLPSLQAPPVTAPKRSSISTTTARLTNIEAGQSYALTKPNVTLGRDDNCDISIEDANISRQHAQLSQDVVGTWKISDLGSTNGTKLNGSPVTSALLRDGDQITVGITVLEFRER